jgi:hypothetical protein
MAKAKEKGIGKVIGEAIDKEIEKEGCKDNKKWHHHAGGGDAVYGIGLIGALVYFIQHAAGFWMGVLGILKAIVWPAILIYRLLGMAGM